MRFRLRGIVAALFAASVALPIVSGCSMISPDREAASESSEPQVLVFAALPSQRSATLQQSHQPIIEMLKKETGKEVRFQTGTEYAAVIEGSETER